MKKAVLYLVVTLTGSPVFLGAQVSEREDVHIRNDCRLAGQVIRTGHPAPRKEWAYDFISQCEVTGPRVLAEIWRGLPPADHEGLWALTAATRPLADPALFAAVAEAAERRSLSTAARVYALGLITSYASPTISLDTRDLMDTTRLRPPRIWSVSDHTDHDVSALGDILALVRTILARVAAQDPDPIVRRAATAHQNLLTALFPVPEPE